MTTRHHGQSASTVASNRPTARGGARLARLLRDLAIGDDLPRLKAPEHGIDSILERPLVEGPNLGGHGHCSESGDRKATICWR